MFYLRKYETFLLDENNEFVLDENGEKVKVIVKLDNARLQGIMTEKYNRASCPSFDCSYTTRFEGNDTIIKHPVENEFCAVMARTDGLHQIYVDAIEESIEEDWFGVSNDGNNINS